MKTLLKTCGYIIVIWFLIGKLASYTFGTSSGGGNGGGNDYWYINCYMNEKNPKKICHVQLGDTIVSSGGYYQLRSKLLELSPDVTVVHLAGWGGSVDGAIYLINLISELPGTTMQVDGDVYSAHALLAFAGSKLIIPQNSLFYFHLSSGTNMERTDCLSQVLTLDRGNWGYTSCVKQSEQINNLQNAVILKYLRKILHGDEITSLISGGTVVLPSSEIYNRLKGK